MKGSPSDRIGTRTGGQLYYLLALGLFACALVFSFCYPGSALEVAGGQALTSNLLWFLACCAACLSSMFVRRQTQNQAHWSWKLLIPVFALTACLALVCTATILIGPAANYRSAINAMWQWVTSGAIVLTSVMLYRCRPGQNDKLVSAVLLVALVIGWNLAIYGCYQSLVEIPYDIHRFETDPQKVLREAGVDPGDQARYLLFRGRLYDGAPTATYSLTNNLAIILAVSSILVAGLFLRLWTRGKPRAAAMLVVVGGPIALCLLWTKSRTAWLAVIAALAWLAIINLRFLFPGQRERRIAIALSACTVLVSVGGIYVWDSSILTDALMSLSYRMRYWVTTTDIIAHHPWLGVASGNFQDYYSQFKSADAAETVSDPHSMWFETAASGGFLAGLFLLIGTVSLVVTSGLHDWRRNRSNEMASDQNPSTQNDLNLYAALVIGAIVGWLLPWVVFPWLDALPGLTLYEIGLPATGVLMYLVYRYYGDAIQFASGTLSAIAVTFLVSLTFSGGWMTPGVSNLLFVIVGMMICSDVFAHEPNSDVRPRGRAATMLASLAALFVLFYGTTWYPVQSAASRLRALRNSSSLPSTQALQELVELDPIDPALWLFASEVEWSRCARLLAQQSQPVAIDSPIFNDYHRFSSGFIDRNRQSWVAVTHRANWQFELASINNMQWMQGVIADFDRAAVLYPVDVEVLIQAALAHFVDGDYDAANRYLSRAESIDKLNTHLEQKIQVGKVYWPQSFARQIQLHAESPTANLNVWQNNSRLWNSGRSIIGKNAGNLEAEPLAKAMRTILDAHSPTLSSPPQ